VLYILLCFYCCTLLCCDFFSCVVDFDHFCFCYCYVQCYCCYLLYTTSVASWVVSSSLNPLQNRETQHVNIVLQCMYWIFWTAQCERKSCLNQMVKHILNWFFLPKPGFLEFIWILWNTF
jgi:hypothetical protein